ncbi:hypothetical protein LTR66_001002 [Elasticomyces elasticus]|nr:hypothetical protein LTR66_001002 [Elasticomyces elasticus]
MTYLRIDDAPVELDNSGTLKSRHSEWKPFMLRHTPSFALAILYCLLVGALEIFNAVMHKHKGLPASQETLVRLARYLPTALVVLLAFAWKSLVSDVKAIMPWAAMTDRWSNRADSVDLNYVDALEVVSVWTAIRRKHYVVSIVIVFSLLSGFLVPLANSLVYTDPQATVTENVEVYKTSHSIDGTLAAEDGSLMMPIWDGIGNQPYAALVSPRQPNGQFPRWTSDGYAFESYRLYDKPLANSTVRVNVSALAPSLDCQAITTSLERYAIDSGYFLEFQVNLNLIADRNDLDSAGCKTALVQTAQAPLPAGQSVVDTWTANWAFNTTNAGQVPAAWLNVTDCSDDGSDVRIVANILQPYGKPPPTANYTPAEVFRVQSLLCRPRYSMGTVTLQTNTTNNDILALEVQH